MLATEQSTALDNSASVLHGSGVMLQVKLLQFVRPQDFDNFKHFVRWRDTTANILLQILQRAAQVPASEDDKYGCWLAFDMQDMPLIMFLQCMLDLGPCHCTICAAMHTHSCSNLGTCTLSLVIAYRELVHVFVRCVQVRHNRNHCYWRVELLLGLSWHQHSSSSDLSATAHASGTTSGIAHNIYTQATSLHPAKHAAVLQ